MRTVLYSILLGLGVKNVKTHPDAVSAYAEIEAFDPNLILTDWKMKPMDGLDFIRKVRMSEDSPNPYVPIVMVTAYNHVDKVMQARNAGANEFLIKPVSAKSVYLRIRNTMEKAQPFVRSETYFGPKRRRRDLGPPPSVAERRTERSTKIVAA
jgi:DNA-binding response OmpR family regulator